MPKPFLIPVVTLNRGCCRVKDVSSVCPSGDNYQIEESDNPVYTKYLTRCEGSLCNSDEGNVGTSSNGNGCGTVVVSGKAGSGAGELNAAGLAATLVISAFTIMRY